MRRSTIFAASFLSFIAAVGACSSPTGEEDLESTEANATKTQLSKVFDVNDVSVLFPLAANGLPQPAIGADDSLLDPAHFQAILAVMAKEGATNVPAANDKKNWKIVGFRFDPCAPGIGLGAATIAAFKGCKIQLRLIAQPFIPTANGVTDFDSTAHLVFQIGSAPSVEALATATLNDGKTTLKNVVDRLVAIKQSSAKSGFETSGKPLGPHLGMNNAATASLATKLITDLLTPAMVSSRGIAFMGIKNGGFEPWVFAAGVVGPDNQWHVIPSGQGVPAPIQTLAFVGVPRGADALITPPGSAELSTSPLFATPKAADKSLAFKVEAGSTHFFNTDCVSCHTSSARTFALNIGDGPELSDREHAPPNITAYVTRPNAQDNTWNTRNFGYFTQSFVKKKGQPTVSQRTANETAEIVSWINLNIIKAPVKAANRAGPFLNGPGKDCSKDKTGAAKADGDNDVFLCLRKGAANCFDNCAPAPVPEGNKPVNTVGAPDGRSLAPCEGTRDPVTGLCIPS